MKQRNPRYGCPRIAQQINLAFGLDLDKDTVRRVLAVHYKPDPGNHGPSWLTTIGHAKDSLWSVDLFRCESILLKSHWIMVVMDQYTRRIIGFAVHAGNVDGPTLCRMFNHATSGQGWPKYLSSDNDPLFQYHRWKANLRVLEIEEIKSLPHVRIRGQQGRRHQRPPMGKALSRAISASGGCLKWEFARDSPIFIALSSKKV
jgi:transposase InsO family protein